MKKQLLGAAGLLTVGLVAGSAFAITGANAADNTTAVSTAATSTATTDSTDATNSTIGSVDSSAADDANETSSTSVRDDEKAVSADIETKLKASALAEVPGATVIRVETDGDGAAYEVHLKKADGTFATVTFDSSFKVLATETGLGGGPKGGHGPDGDHDGQGDNDGDGPAFKVPATTTN